MSSITPRLILASTSKYRAELLKNICETFDQIAPKVEELKIDGEDPSTMAIRLASQKAQAGALLSNCNTPGIVIGSDQVAHFEGTILSKPGNFETARDQLKASSGRWVRFSTGVTLCNERGEFLASGLDHYDVRFRSLSDTTIERYLKAEEPFDCAGSIKAEGKGIQLFSETRGRDINTLYGLPLILLVDLLQEAGVTPGSGNILL